MLELCIKCKASKVNRTTVSEVIGQFLLNLKRTREHGAVETILSDPAFNEALLDCIARIRSGRMKWHDYDEVFG